MKHLLTTVHPAVEIVTFIPVLFNKILKNGYFLSHIFCFLLSTQVVTFTHSYMSHDTNIFFTLVFDTDIEEFSPNFDKFVTSHCLLKRNSTDQGWNWFLR